MPMTAKNGTQPFIPELWQAALMEPFEKAIIFGQEPVVGSDFTGQITQKGDTVHVSAIGDITISDYNANQDITIQDLTVTDATLKVDQGKLFAFYVEDVEALQAEGSLKDPALTKAGAGLANTMDAYIAGIFKTDAGSKLSGKVHQGRVSDVPKASKLPYEVIVELSTALGTKNVPESSRYVIVGPKFHGALLLDERFTNSAAYGKTDGIQNGKIGRISGMDVYVSNNVPVTGQKEMVCAGMYGAISRAVQINKVETVRSEKRMADVVRGLMIYGAKAFRPEALTTFDADFAA